ncbi:MAG: AAA family ATPase [Planctomycetes bacterium]|nr:AAA family ATPase [Planctomycetota bacterium]
MGTRLHSVAIANFRGIQSGSLAGLTDVNVLVGRNSTGKSTVLEALALASQPAPARGPVARVRQDLLQQIAERRNEANGLADTWWYRGDRSADIQVDLRFDSESGRQVVVVLQSGRAPAFADSDDQAKHYLGGTVLFDGRWAMAHQIERVLWGDLVRARGDRDVARHMNELFDLGVEGFSEIDGAIHALLPAAGTPIDLLGDGARVCFRLLILLRSVGDSALLFEEPETHQHPASLERMARAVCDGAKEQSIQVFLSTHSRECVGWFLEAARASGLEPTVFHTALSAGKFSARRVPADSARTLEELGTDLRHLYRYG